MGNAWLTREEPAWDRSIERTFGEIPKLDRRPRFFLKTDSVCRVRAHDGRSVPSCGRCD